MNKVMYSYSNVQYLPSKINRVEFDFWVSGVFAGRLKMSEKGFEGMKQKLQMKHIDSYRHTEIEVNEQ